MNEQTYNSWVCITNLVPFNAWPFSNIGWGTVTFTDSSIAFSYKKPFVPFAPQKQFTLPFTDIDSYSRYMGDIFVHHHSSQCPKLVELVGGNKFLGGTDFIKTPQNDQ